MKTKKRLLHIAILTFMVFSASFIIPSSLAYWSNIQMQDTAQASVIIGEWNQIFDWDEDKIYEEGDLVFYNGELYEAKRDNPTREPGSPGSRKDWTPQ